MDFCYKKKEIMIALSQKNILIKNRSFGVFLSALLLKYFSLKYNVYFEAHHSLVTFKITILLFAINIKFYIQSRTCNLVNDWSTFFTTL